MFAFAGAGGAVDELVPLADALTGDPRVVALALAAETGGVDTVETMAGAAVALIRAEQPRGPYRLLGYSFGGLLALESARLLSDAGDAVAFVGLVDSVFDQRYWPTALFLGATGRRTLQHARGLAGRSPAHAAQELTERTARLAGRVLSRYRPAVEGTTGPATPQDANVAVMARWRPRVFLEAVTLFAATGTDFGCDLAALWRPWLPRLTLRRVPGHHLDLIRTATGAARLGRAVSEELEPPSPQLKVLLATTFRWPGAARLAVDFHEVGCVVDAVAPRGSALHAVTAVNHGYRLGLADPIGSLRRAIESSAADVIVPFDDRTRQALSLLHTRSDPRTETGARLRRRLERSLGAPERFGCLYSREAVMTIARACGVSCPPTAAVGSAHDLSTWFEQHPGPAVLKTDGSWGGRDVAIVHDEAEGRRIWREMSRPSLARALKRLLVEGDPWALRAWCARTRPSLSIQAYVAGRPANAAIACFGGTTLGTVQAEVVESNGPTGPSTMVRLIDNPDMTYAATSVVGSLGLSGLCGLDFILDDDGRAHLLELNPRGTPTSHLLAADGTDLLTALRTAFGYKRPPARAVSRSTNLVALFPQEPSRDVSSASLWLAHHDVPAYAPDLVAYVLAGDRRARRMAPLPVSTRSLGLRGRHRRAVTW